MLTAALLELTEDPGETVKELNALGLPEVEFVAEKTTKLAIVGTRVRVFVAGVEEGAEHHDHSHGAHHHHHDHDGNMAHHHAHDGNMDHHHGHDDDHDDNMAHHHDHDHHDVCRVPDLHQSDAHDHGMDHPHDMPHHHRSLRDIEHVISEHIRADEAVKEDIRRVFRIIADAESIVHGRPVPEIHFHEVGSMDAIADVTAVCYLIHKLGIQQILASPVHVGRGTIKCAHGILPVPPPAAALILKGIPVYSIPEIEGELCTPTGAAVLKAFVSEFKPMPVMTYDRIGYGMGSRDYPILSCVRAFLGEVQA